MPYLTVPLAFRLTAVGFLSLLFSALLPAQETFVAVGMEGKILRSQNGIEWQDYSVDHDDRHFHALIWNGDEFMAVGEHARAESGEGKEWDFHRTRDQSRDVAYGNEVYLSVGSGRNVEVNRSEDGRRWRPVELPSVFSQDVNLQSIEFGNGRFVAVADDGASAVTLDGNEWIASQDGRNAPQFGAEVLFGGGRFLLIGGKTHFISEDGQSWHPVEIDPERPVLGRSPKVWADTYFLIIDPLSGKVYRSPDGVRWQIDQAQGAFPKIGGIAFANSRFIGIDYGDQLVASQDGLRWEVVRPREKGADFSGQLQDVAAGLTTGSAEKAPD